MAHIALPAYDGEYDEIKGYPKMIFTSFGDPYKLYEFPFLHTYINAFSYAESTQRGFVKVLLGEVEATAKSPVALPGFFDREV